MKKKSENRLTQEQYDSMLLRRQQLTEDEIPQNAKDIEQAKEHGDLSENAEYNAAKERQATLHGELTELEERLARAVIIQQNDRFDVVQVGHKVTIRHHDSNKTETFLLIGQDGDGVKNIDISSKLGHAVLEKKIGEHVSYEANDPSIGIVTFEVVNIE